MALTVAEIEREIRALKPDEQERLLRALVPKDPTAFGRRLMLIDLSFAASCCSTFFGPTIEAAMPASSLAAKRRRRWRWAQL
jgi:hypothetical protein